MAKKIVFNQIDIFLLAQRALYIPQYGVLVVSDWHLGKLKHFRSEGLFVPTGNMIDELATLDQLIHEWKATKVVFLGDLFHSKWNSDWEKLAEYCTERADIAFLLTKGNHDIIPIEIVEKSLIQFQDSICLGTDLVLSHEPLADLPSQVLNIVGHIHPGFAVRGKGRQVFRLPCFHLHKQILTVPAFGKWTGLHLLKPDQEARFFVIIDRDVLEI